MLRRSSSDAVSTCSVSAQSECWWVEAPNPH